MDAQARKLTLLRAAKDYAPVILMVFTGLFVSILLAISGFAPGLIPTLAPYFANPQVNVVIGLLSILCFSIGAERAAHLAQIDGTLREVAARSQLILEGQTSELQQTMRIEAAVDSLESRVSRLSKARFVEGFEDIFTMAVPHVRAARNSIRATGNAYSNPSPEFWVSTVRERLLIGRREQRPVEYTIKMFIKFDSLDVAEVKRMGDRIAKFSSGGLEKLVRFRFFNSNSIHGMDALIIDDQHVHLRFSGRPGVEDAKNFGLLIEGDPAVAAAMTFWYDNLGEGISLSDLARIASSVPTASA